MTQPMTREERAKHTALENALDRAAAAERRALADIRTAGWEFASLDEAREYRRNYRLLNQMSRAELIDLISGKRTA